MKSTAQIYENTIAAGASIQLLVAGGFYKLLSATGTVTVSREGGSTIGPLLPGQGEREQFYRLTVTNTSGAINNVRILVADESFIDTRVYGAVEFVNGQAIRTKNNFAWSSGGPCPSVAAQMAHVQLWNPVGSGVNVFVTEVSFCDTSGAAGTFQMRYHNANLLTIVGSSRAKKVDLAAHPTVFTYIENNASAIGTSFGGRYMVIANGTHTLQPTDPIELPPGWGLITVNTVLGGTNASNFQFYTEAINT